MTAVVDVQANVEVELPPAVGVTLVGLRVQLSPVDGANDAVRLTTPLNRF